MTKPDAEVVSVVQEKVIAALMRGATITDAALEAEVSRQTVSGWCNHDPVFIATLNRYRREAWDQVQDRIRTLQIQALDAISLDLQGSGVSDLALQVLKIMPAANAAPQGPTTAAQVKSQQTMLDLLAL